MSDEVFYLKARMSEARAAMRQAKTFKHDDAHYQTLKTFLQDLARNLANQRPDEFEAAFHYVIRTMGVIVQQNATEAYLPHGYLNPFKPSPAPAAAAAAPPPPKRRDWTRKVVYSPPSRGSSGFDVAFRQYSALKMFGYTVGKTDGWTEPERQEFLSDFIEMDLPPIVKATFGDEYGAANSAARLRKVANVIAGNANNFYRNDPVRFEVAISDWEDDLMFLKRKYYERAGLKFLPWPATRNR